MQKILRIDPKDNLIVALRDLAQGDIIENDGNVSSWLRMSPPSISLPGNPCLWEASLRCTACPWARPSPRSSPASASPWTTWSTTRRKSI